LNVSQPLILVLVVDDSREHLDLIQAYFRPHDYRVLTASDGREGLAMVRKHKPDLILLDFQMPILDGRGVVDALNIEQIEIPVILMTGQGSEQIAVEMFRKGARDYLIKPFDEPAMISAIERTLIEVRLRREKDEITERLIIANAKLNKRLRELKILYSIGKSVTALMDIEGLMLRIVGAATLLTSSDEGSIFVIEEEHLVCRAIKSHGEKRPFISKQVFNDPLAARAVESNEVVILTPEEIATGQWGNAASSAMAAPLMIADRCIGVLVVKNVLKDTPPFTAYDGELLSALSDYASIAFENASHYKNEGEIGADDKATIREAFKPKSIFISYSRVDWKDFVEPMVKQMRDSGLNIWLDQNLLEGGQDWLDKINEVLDTCDYMVLCVSPDALKSPNVKIEYRYFFHQNKPIIPIICREAKLPFELLSFHHLPYTDVEKLIKWLKKSMAQEQISPRE
jgi:CheY-like chemotaxis protein